MPRVVRLTGEIDVYTARRACRALDEIDGPAVVDLSGVRLLSAAGLHRACAARVPHGQRRRHASGAPPHVRRVLTIARFDELFHIDD